MTRIREIYPMPFDRWDGEEYIHATGREYWDCITNGWCTEYEDDATCSLPVTDPEYDYDWVPEDVINPEEEVLDEELLDFLGFDFDEPDGFDEWPEEAVEEE